ncbi:hypothetical protein L3X38_000942 [Prunus dulcis]|uniref:Uncharacterized protein n=1 Tax=Prunus dulcis TaxID=3755 RepID=A0AAD4ZJD5_PRUDU|nr:hypothetical protein L3X38_000942 [Prunus dulcis]
MISMAPEYELPYYHDASQEIWEKYASLIFDFGFLAKLWVFEIFLDKPEKENWVELCLTTQGAPKCMNCSLNLLDW